MTFIVCWTIKIGGTLAPRHNSIAWGNIYRARLVGLLSKHGADAGNDVVYPLAVFNDLNESRLHFREIGFRSLQPSQTGIRTRHNCRQRLFDFVRNRRGHGAHGCLPRSVRELALQGVQLFLGLFEIGDVPGHCINTLPVWHREP
jgi:hypothetical protein